MSTTRSDILVTDHDGRPVAAIEVKNRQQLSRDVATVLRRNLFLHGYVPHTPYYLLLSQDVGYLWKNQERLPPDSPPSYEFPLGNVIDRYLKSTPKRRLSGQELELVLLKWLIDQTLEHPEPTEEPEITLASAGFGDAIRGGRVIAEAAA